MIIIKSRILSARISQCLKFKRLISDSYSNNDIFKNYFELPTPEIKHYITYNKLTQITPDTLMKIAEFCEEHGYTKRDMLENPAVFRMNPTSIDQQYTVMREGGFVNIKLKHLTKFRTLCRKSIIFLKQMNFIKLETNVAKSFISHLNPCPEGFYVNSSCDIWCEVHLRILIEYLKWRLEASEDKIYKLIETHPMVRRKSFKYLCENIRFAEELGFTKERILKNGYILNSFPKSTQTIIEKYPEIAGVSIKKCMRMYPKLMAINPSNIQEIFDILKKHNIPDEAIARRFNIFYLSPETVDFRLKELERVNDFKVLLHNPNILRLVVHHNRAKSRLSFLKELQLKCATVTVLGTDDNRFDNHIREGRDENSFSDTYAFLRGIFKTDDRDFESILKRHPFYLQVPLTTMEETYRFLVEENFSNRAICKVIYLILYPKEKIQKSFQQIKQYENQTKRLLTQVNKLNLALYFIEKEHHFTGDGIWTKPELIDENIHSS